MIKSLFKKFLLIFGCMMSLMLTLPDQNSPSVVKADQVTKTKQTNEVKETLPQIKLNVKSKDLVKGKSYTLKIYNTNKSQTVTFHSSDSSIVTVNSDGEIKGIDIGTAVITATVRNQNKVVETLTCDINVGVPAISIRFTKSEMILVVGQTTTLKTLIAPYNTVEQACFTSLDSSIASISTGGRITAKDTGSTFVYALIDNGYSRCKITVIDQETYQSLNELGISDLSNISKLEVDSPSSSKTPTLDTLKDDLMK